MKKRILITVGGTGGHIFPALGLANQLQKIHPEIELFFAGGKLASNSFFQSSKFSYQDIACSPFPKNPVTALKGGYQILKGYFQSNALIRKFSPNLVVGFGSYHTFSLLLAAALKKVPIVLHEANSIPGKVNQFFAAYAALTGVHFPEAANYLKGKVKQVSLPLREGFAKDVTSTHTARLYFGLDPDKWTFLIFGGSQGADALNRFFMNDLKEIFTGFPMPFQVIHFTGKTALYSQIKENYAHHQIPACVKLFENRMDLAWQAANISITRAGAASIAEQVEYEVPGILIPYPYATDQHQDKNADFMVSEGVSFKISEAQLNGKKVALLLQELMRCYPEMQKKALLTKSKSKMIDFGTIICEMIL